MTAWRTLVDTHSETIIVLKIDTTSRTPFGGSKANFLYTFLSSMLMSHSFPFRISEEIEDLWLRRLMVACLQKLHLCLVIAVFPCTSNVHGAELSQDLTAAFQAYDAHLDDPEYPALYETALLTAALAADAHPQDARPYWLLGNLYMRYGDNRIALERAEEALHTALDLAPDDARIRFSLGQCYFLQRHFYSARTLWLGLLTEQDLAVLSPVMLSQTMQAYLLNDDLEIGLQELPVLRQQHPDNPWLAALHSGLLSVKHRLVANEASREQMQELRQWWQQYQPGDELRDFVMTTWLELP